MNFEFGFKELPAVLRGPRIERRRVLIGGSAFWGTMRDDTTLVLDDGREVAAATAHYLPPVNPSKIIAVHISYTSRSVETRRHWHTPCWSARGRRKPKIERTRNAPKY